MVFNLAKAIDPLTRVLPRVGVMDRYIIGELIAPFLFGVGAFSSIGVAIGTVFDLVRQLTDADISLAIALKVFFLQLPYYISLSLPMAMLLATLIGYSRLSSDSELIALRSCGVSVYRLVVPAIAAGLLISGINFTFNELVVPATRYEASLTLDRALKNETNILSERNIIYPEFREIEQPDGEEVDVLNRLFYAEQFDGERMIDLTIIDRSQPGFDQLILAKTATWNPVKNNWDFFNGTIYFVDRQGEARKIVRFKHQRLQLPRAPLDFAAQERKFGEMNIVQALNHLEVLKLSGRDKKVRKLKIRIQQKIALPFACVAFGLLGAALGTKPQRTSKATGFGISVLTIFTYYLLMSIGDALGLSGVIAPWMAGWLPTLVGFFFGGFLLLRAAR
jgi:lipopolysaccharide export system permease protein